jgi:hypothetical protein
MPEIYITHRTKGRKNNLSMIHIKCLQEKIYILDITLKRDDENKIML